MSTAKLTRFGADPTREQELATKNYVDNSSGGGRDFYWVGSAIGLNVATGTTFFMVSESGANTVVTFRKSPAPFDCLWRDMGVRCQTNSADETAHWVSNIEEVVANQHLDVGAGLTGYFEDLVNTDTLSAGDFIIWEYTRGGSGTYQVNGIIGRFVEQ